MVSIDQDDDTIVGAPEWLTVLKEFASHVLNMMEDNADREEDEDQKKPHQEIIALAPRLIDLLQQSPTTDTDAESFAAIRWAVLKCYIAALQEADDYTTLLTVLGPKSSSTPGKKKKKGHATTYEIPVMEHVVDVTKDPTLSSLQQQLKAYTLYRLERYKEVLTLIPDDSDDLFWNHIKAQSLYHLCQSTAASSGTQCDKALNVYENLIDKASSKDDDAMVDLWTNLLAVTALKAVPYVPTDLPSSSLTNAIQQTCASSTQDSTSEDVHELAFNFATMRLLGRDDSSAMDLLQGYLQEDLEDTVATETLGPLLVNREWSDQFWKKPRRSTTNDNNVVVSQAAGLVRRINLALTLSNPKQNIQVFEDPAIASVDGTTADPAIRWTPLQQRLILYNKTLLQLHAGQYDQSRKTCQALSKMVGDSKKATTDLWWQSRVVVLDAYCAKGGLGRSDVTEKQVTAALGRVDTLLQQLDDDTSLETNAVNASAWLYLQCHRSHLQGTSESTEDLLRRLLDHKDCMPKRSIKVTLAHLYYRQGKLAEASKLLSSTDVLGDDTANDVIFAEFAMSQEKYQEAAEMLSKHQDVDAVAKARYIQALSHVDPDQAQQLWQTFSRDQLGGEKESLFPGTASHGAELEQTDLLRLKLRKTGAMDQSQHANDADPDSNSQPKRDKDAILRRRARKREAYLEDLERKGLYRKDHPTKPDPERWLPKYERSYARRRRQQKQGRVHRGAQGGVSDIDASKLDVAARQEAIRSGQAFVDGGSKSTAHLTVSSAGRKGGKRR